MKDNKPTIGVDIDNVIAKTDEEIRKIIRNTFGVDLAQHDITVYKYHKCGISKQQEQEALEIFHRGACSSVDLIEGAKESLSLLKQSYEIILVTSRWSSSREATEHWLNTKGIPHDVLIFEDRKDKTPLMLDYFVEDRWKYAFKMAEAGVKVFLFSYPWNTNRPSHPNIKRVDGWREVLETLIYKGSC